jgi:hypothetical protein
MEPMKQNKTTSIGKPILVILAVIGVLVAILYFGPPSHLSAAIHSIQQGDIVSYGRHLDKVKDIHGLSRWSEMTLTHALVLVVEDDGLFEQAIEIYIAKGGGVNGRDRGDNTPLHYAARRGDVCKYEILKKHGADPMLQDGNEMSAEELLLWTLSQAQTE